MQARVACIILLIYCCTCKVSCCDEVRVALPRGKSALRYFHSSMSHHIREVFWPVKRMERRADLNSSIVLAKAAAAITVGSSRAGAIIVVPYLMRSGPCARADDGASVQRAHGCRMYRRRSLHHHHQHLLHHHGVFTRAAIYACSRPSLPSTSFTFTHPTSAARHSLSTDNY